MIFEVCANSVQSAIYADKAGADRIELCQNLNEGGTTPSFASIDFCLKNFSLKTFVLVRPRAGHFVYSDVEFDIIRNDVLQCKVLGVAGVVVGFLHPDFTIDKNKTTEIVACAAPMEVTFHRAFDISDNLFQSMEDIIDCGCHRILTSGGKHTAIEGIAVLNQLHRQAAKRITLIAASGINPNNIQSLLSQTQITEFHASCKQQRGLHSNKNILDISNNIFEESNEESIREMVRLIH
jgi:copper homeostasis protein